MLVKNTIPAGEVRRSIQQSPFAHLAPSRLRGETEPELTAKTRRAQRCMITEQPSRDSKASPRSTRSTRREIWQIMTNDQ